MPLLSLLKKLDYAILDNNPTRSPPVYNYSPPPPLLDATIPRIRPVLQKVVIPSIPSFPVRVLT